MNQITQSTLFDQHSKYSKWYLLLMDRAIIRGKPEEYSERHHIIPFCFSKSNASENLVWLTGREHFIAHLLLAKAAKQEYKRSMIWAIRKMLIHGKKQNRIVSSRTFELGRKLFSVEQSKRMTEYWSDPKNREAHSKKLKNKLASPEARTLKREAALRGSTPDVVARRAAGHRGLKHSEATKQKMRASYQLRISHPNQTRLVENV